MLKHNVHFRIAVGGQQSPLRKPTSRGCCKKFGTGPALKRVTAEQAVVTFHSSYSHGIMSRDAITE